MLSEAELKAREMVNQSYADKQAVEKQIVVLEGLRRGLPLQVPLAARGLHQAAHRVRRRHAQGRAVRRSGEQIRDAMASDAAGTQVPARSQPRRAARAPPAARRAGPPFRPAARRRRPTPAAGARPGAGARAQRRRSRRRDEARTRAGRTSGGRHAARRRPGRPPRRRRAVPRRCRPVRVRQIRDASSGDAPAARREHLRPHRPPAALRGRAGAALRRRPAVDGSDPRAPFLGELPTTCWPTSTARSTTTPSSGEPRPPRDRVPRSAARRSSERAGRPSACGRERRSPQGRGAGRRRRRPRPARRLARCATKPPTCPGRSAASSPSAWRRTPASRSAASRAAGPGCAVLIAVVCVALAVALWQGAGAFRRALALVLGGAAGNLIDRLRFGYVARLRGHRALADLQRRRRRHRRRRRADRPRRLAARAGGRPGEGA